MLKNYINTAIRNLKKNPLYTLINVFGLAVGMACCIVILLFVQDELSFDRYHENADNLYRITSHWEMGGRELHYATAPGTMGPSLVEEYPEIIDSVRVVIHRWFVVEYEGKKLTTDPIFADPSLLDVFSFPLLQGDKNSALADPNSVVISEDLAEKFFGDSDPMGKVLTLYSLNDHYDLQVTGLLKNIPYNSHFRFDFLVPIEHLRIRAQDQENWLRTCNTYLLLDKHAEPKSIQEKIQQFMDMQSAGRQGVGRQFVLQPLTSIHLNSSLALEIEQNSNLTYSYFLSAVAFIILLIACINFMNLSTARSSQRYKEVGMRKVVGADRIQLFRQFLGESLLLAFIALVVGLFLAILLLPFFNSLLYKHLALNFTENPVLFIGLGLLTLLVGFLAGAYPAVFLSSFRPVDVLKSEFRRGGQVGVLLRKGLVVFQFALSLIFIIGVLVISQQLNYVKNKDLGFDKNNIIQISIFKDSNLCERPELIKRELSQHPNVLDVIVSSGAPGFYNGYPTQCFPEGFAEDESFQLNLIQVGEDFFDFFNIEMVAGRAFSKEITSDKDSAVILNETAAKSLGWTSPLGKQIRGDRLMGGGQESDTAVVIGVVKDFHNGSLHEEIKPTVYKYWPDRHGEILVRIRPDNIKETLAFLEKKWRELPTHLIFTYNFIDTSLEDNIYRQDKRVAKIFTFAAILAIILACLGLFSLASYSSERRVKEIGVRKVLGASVLKIILLLNKDFSILVLIANLVSWPIAYYVMHRWLQDFAYRAGIAWWQFAAAAILTFSIAVLAISYHSINAATANPVDSLRYE
jgi:putative ABC transport system permease protein